MNDRVPPFLGNYADIATVKTRNVFVVKIEIPMEKYQAFVAAFGGPLPAQERLVAIALMDPEKAVSEPAKATEAIPKERRKWNSLPLAQQAAMRCAEAGFQRFAMEEHGALGDEESTVEFVREFCGVKSRSEIKVGTPAGEAWANIDSEYFAWLHV